MNVLVIVCECGVKCGVKYVAAHLLYREVDNIYTVKSPCVQMCGHKLFHVHVCSSDRQTDPLSALSAVKYELLRCYETRSLWLNLQ